MKSNYRYIIPPIIVVIMAIGCFIHSIEYSPSITVYYALTVIMAWCGFAIGFAIDM